MELFGEVGPNCGEVGLLLGPNWGEVGHYCYDQTGRNEDFSKETLVFWLTDTMILASISSGVASYENKEAEGQCSESRSLF